MKLKVVIPILRPASVQNINAVIGRMQAVASKGTEIGAVYLDKGPASIECHYDEALATPDILTKVKEAEDEGYDAVFIDCFGDPGVKAARELVNIPVVGAGEPAMLLAALLGERFSVVSILKNILSMIRDNATVLGVGSKMISVRNVNIPVLDLQDEEKLLASLQKEMLSAINEDDAHVLVLGCTGMTRITERIRSNIVALGYNIPILDPVPTAIKFLEMLTELKTSQSKLTYMPIPDKLRVI